MTEDEFVKLLEKLQQKIENEEEETYSKIVIREYRNPSNFGVLANPNAVGEIKGPCGDTMKITLYINDDKIVKANFWTDGCGSTIACGSMLTKIIKGKTLKEAKSFSTSQLLKNLEGLPKDHYHCTVLAINTLKKAIKNHDDEKK
jgi:nitrogen fixation NifU-like protein